MNEPSRAATVLARVLEAAPPTLAQDPWFAIVIRDSWTEGPDVVCMIYRQETAYPGLTRGLRRTAESDWPVDDVSVLIGR